MHFRYTAYDRSGEVQLGTLEAASAEEAEERLWRRELVVTSVRRARSFPARHELFPSLFGVKQQTLLAFTRQLVTLLEAGFPILKALETLLAQPLHPLLRNALQDIYNHLIQGESVSEGLARHPEVFPRLYTRMALLGESTGNLAAMLQRVVDAMEKQAESSRRLKSALTYPALVLLASLGAVYVLVTFTVPMMSGLFREFGGEAPLMTRVVLAVSDFVVNFGTTVAALLVGFGVLGWLYTRTRSGAQRRDELLFRLPVLGTLIRKTQIATFSETLTRVMSAGVPLMDALTLSRDTASNATLRHVLTDVTNRLTVGESLSEACRRHPLVFSPMVVETLRISEESGTLEQQLDLIARIYDMEAEQAVRRFLEVVEPAIILVVGLIVGFIGVTVLTTVYGVLPGIESAGG